MKKSGFTLLELLIGISLISAIMIFLFRLLHDITNEGMSNVYLVENQTNRNEIMSLINTAIVENGKIHILDIDKKPSQTDLTFVFTSGKQLDMSILRNTIKIQYNNQKYTYSIKPSTAHYNIDIAYDTFSYNGHSFLKIDIQTTKKGLKSATIDDIEIFGETQALSLTKRTSDSASYDTSNQEQFFISRKAGNYKIELWAPENVPYPAATGNYGYYAVGTYYLDNGDRLLIKTPDAISWTYCARENATCTYYGTKTVAYGIDTRWKFKTQETSISCNNSTFGDPAPGPTKSCYYGDSTYLSASVYVLNNQSGSTDPENLTLIMSASNESADISNENLTNKHASCYNCTPSDNPDNVITSTECTNASPTGNCTKQGGGFVKVSYVGN